MTYSVATKGAVSGGANFVNNLTTNRGVVIPDSTSTNVGTQAVAVQGGMYGAMSTGAQVLCQGPDGGTRWYVFDDRSTFNNPILRAV